MTITYPSGDTRDPTVPVGLGGEGLGERVKGPHKCEGHFTGGEILSEKGAVFQTKTEVHLQDSRK